MLYLNKDNVSTRVREDASKSRSPTGRLGIVCYLLNFLLQRIELRRAIEFAMTASNGTAATFKITCQVTQIGRQ